MNNKTRKNLRIAIIMALIAVDALNMAFDILKLVRLADAESDKEA